LRNFFAKGIRKSPELSDDCTRCRKRLLRSTTGKELPRDILIAEHQNTLDELFRVRLITHHSRHEHLGLADTVGHTFDIVLYSALRASKREVVAHLGGVVVSGNSPSLRAGPKDDGF